MRRASIISLSLALGSQEAKFSRKEIARERFMDLLELMFAYSLGYGLERILSSKIFSTTIVKPRIVSRSSKEEDARI